MNCGSGAYWPWNGLQMLLYPPGSSYHTLELEMWITELELGHAFSTG